MDTNGKIIKYILEVVYNLNSFKLWGFFEGNHHNIVTYKPQYSHNIKWQVNITNVYWNINDQFWVSFACP